MSLFSSSHKVLCTFCKLQRRIYPKNEVSIFDVTILLFVTGLFAFVVWGTPDLRSLILFMTLTFVLQVFMRVRWRESIKCPHCGFDPVLYKSNNEEAAQKVKAFLEKRKDNPKYLLKPKPQIKPLRIKAQKGLMPIMASQDEIDLPLVDRSSDRPLDVF